MLWKLCFECVYVGKGVVPVKVVICGVDTAPWSSPQALEALPRGVMNMDDLCGFTSAPLPSIRRPVRCACLAPLLMCTRFLVP